MYERLLSFGCGCCGHESAVCALHHGITSTTGALKPRPPCATLVLLQLLKGCQLSALGIQVADAHPEARRCRDANRRWSTHGPHGVNSCHSNPWLSSWASVPARPGLTTWVRYHPGLRIVLMHHWRVIDSLDKSKMKALLPVMISSSMQIATQSEATTDL